MAIQPGNCPPTYVFKELKTNTQQTVAHEYLLQHPSQS